MVRIDVSKTLNETRPPLRYSDRSCPLPEELPVTEPLLPKPRILPLELVVRNHASTLIESSGHVCTAVTTRPLLVPLKRAAASGSPDTAPVIPRVTPLPTVAFT